MCDRYSVARTSSGETVKSEFKKLARLSDKIDRATSTCSYKYVSILKFVFATLPYQNAFHRSQISVYVSNRVVPHYIAIFRFFPFY